MKFFLPFCLVVFPVALFAQQSGKSGEVERQEITIEKSRRIEIAPATRLYTTQPTAQPAPTARRMTYEFRDRPLTVGEVRLQPNALPTPTGAAGATLSGFTNYLKAGAGNYGTFFGEAYGGIHNRNDYSVDATVRHLGSANGPVDGRNSAQNETNVLLRGGYFLPGAKLSASVGYDREQYYFYGYRPRFDGGNRLVPNRDSLRQTLQTFRIGAGVENRNPDASIDYSLRTNFYYLRDAFRASEIDWGTNFNGSVALTDGLVALVGADAYLNRRTDGATDVRNLFRVRPTFRYVAGAFTVTAGVNAVNQTDQRLNINQTFAFPVAEVDVVPVTGIHLLAGVTGDVERQTLRGFLDENRWLVPQIALVNTVKPLEIYAGSRGGLSGGFSYDVRASYARYRNLSFINNSLPDTSRFFVLYDGGVASLLTLSGQLQYEQKDRFRSTFRADYYQYTVDRVEAPWGRPTFTARWSNRYVIATKFSAEADVMSYIGIQQKNFQTGEQVTLRPIADLSLKFNYLLGERITAFVSLNNVLGRNYQRYLYYPVQGFNFLGGLSYSF